MILVDGAPELICFRTAASGHENLTACGAVCPSRRVRCPAYARRGSEHGRASDPRHVRRNAGVRNTVNTSDPQPKERHLTCLGLEGLGWIS